MKEIVLVEESDAHAALVRRALHILSIANPVRHLFSGAEAIAHLNAQTRRAATGATSSSVLLLDLVLPDMTGLEILEKIAGHPAFEKMFRVVLTNVSDLETITRAYALGAVAFLTKPVQPAHLQEIIENFPGYWSFKVKVPNLFMKPRRGLTVAST